jgi:hypothetical protein
MRTDYACFCMPFSSAVNRAWIWYTAMPPGRSTTAPFETHERLSGSSNIQSNKYIILNTCTVLRFVNFRCPMAGKLNVSHSFSLRPRFSLVVVVFSTSLHHGARRALWRELVVRVSLLKLSKEFRFECFASTTQHFMRCALLVVVCCGVRLAAVSLYSAKRKDAILWRGFRRAQRG